MDEDLLDKYIAAYFKANLPRVVNEIIDERIARETLAARSNHFYADNLEIFESMDVDYNHHAFGIDNPDTIYKKHQRPIDDCDISTTEEKHDTTE